MRPDFIETFTGRRFRPLDPSASDVCIEDIAHALSQQCRFSGHTRVPYSVAEHSVRVADRLRRHSREVRLWGLMHDASEAYLVDIPSPLKCTPAFMQYRIAEQALMLCVCERFGMDYAEPEAVREADAALLALEVRDLMPAKPAHWAGQLGAAVGEEIRPWSARMAEVKFLETFRSLTQ